MHQFCANANKNCVNYSVRNPFSTACSKDPCC